MRKRVLCLLCVAIIATGLFTACDMADIFSDGQPTAQLSPSNEDEAPVTPFISKQKSTAQKTEGIALAAEPVYIFNTIVAYNARAYSIYAAPEIPNFIGIKGSTAFSPLPDGIGKYLAAEDENRYVYNFTIYQDKIYYLAAEPGSDTTFGAVYRCNLDGNQNELLVYANNLSVCMISSGQLYYSAETDRGDYIVCVDRKSVV